MMKFLRFFFYHFYHAFAWTYDFVSALVSVGRWRDWVLTALPYLDGPRVLEIGHGPGHLQAALRKKGLTVFGLDESRQMGRMAFSRLSRLGLPVALARGQAQFLPFGDACFDNLVATFPTEYIFDLRTLEQAYRVLRSPDPTSGRPGGRLVVVPMAWIGGENVLDRAAVWLFRVTRQSEKITDEVKDKIKAPFTAAGFKVRVETVEASRRSSTVLVVIAEKPE